jgi:hypothetical protein
VRIEATRRPAPPRGWVELDPLEHIEGDAKMRFMILVPANSESEAGMLPDEKTLAEMGKFNEELVKSGVLLAGEGLQPTSKGARIRYSGAGKKPTVIDGPFTESKELIAGYWILQVKSKEEAIEWASRAPFGDGVTVEVRQVFESADFAPSDPTGELRKKEQELRDIVNAREGRASGAAPGPMALASAGALP